MKMFFNKQSPRNFSQALFVNVFLMQKNYLFGLYIAPLKRISPLLLS